MPKLVHTSVCCAFCVCALNVRASTVRMRYLALASDYDGTLAHDGVVDDATVEAIERLNHSGRKFILVTGRELPDLQSAFPRLDLCALVVAENGALLYTPQTRETRVLADPPPGSFVNRLREKGVTDMSVGEVIVATWHPYERQAIEAIRESGLELQIIFNKDAVMILPSGVNKMTGLCCALDDLKLSRHNVVGVGDAENDHAFLESCECSVAVANAIPSLKEKADLLTKGARGAGVTELIDKLIENDLSDVAPTLGRYCICVGKSDQGDVNLPAYGRNVLVCGSSGSGKSTLVTGILERIMDKKYQICLIDPEGDYENLPGCRTVGDQKRPPDVEHVKQVLADPSAQVIVNLVGVGAADRADYFALMVSEIQNQRLRTGRPHWLAIDEAHHVLPWEWAHTSTALPDELANLLLITVHPKHVSPMALRKMNTMLVVGREPGKLFEEFANAIHKPRPDVPREDLPRGEAVYWSMDDNKVQKIKTVPSRNEHLRHRRKYAEGQLDPERMFHFRGPHCSLDLRAQNLNIFVQIAEGIDTDTWWFHLKRRDYSTWLRHGIKDGDLADEVSKIEENDSLSDKESRDQVKDAILRKYTVPA